MKAFDFEYNGKLLSDYGFVICTFGTKGLETISNGSKISFNTTPMFNGSKFVLTHSNYDECLEAQFSICKDSCKTLSGDVEPITVDEESFIMRWLNRKSFKKFKLIQEGYEDIYFEGSFNIDRCELDGKVYGFNLSLTTNRPFAVYEPIPYYFSLTTDNLNYSLMDISDEMGHIYPKVKITCKTDGDLIIENSMENRETRIKNCVEGEVINMEYPIITSSIPSHKIQNDFNFNFLRIANEEDKVVNKFTFSIPCNVEITYSPIKKVGV